MIIKQNRTIEKTMHVLWVLWIFFVIAFSDTITMYANICALLMMGLSVLYILQTRRLYLPKQLYCMIFFGILATVSMLWSIDAAITMTRSITTWRMVVLLVLMTNYVRYSGDADFLYKGIEIAGNMTAAYTICRYGLSELRQLVTVGGFRIGGEFVNENALGTFLIISAIISLYQIIHNREYKRIILSVLPLIVSLLTASRKVLFILIISIAFIVWKEISKGNNSNKVRILLVSIIVIAVLVYAYQSPIGSVLRLRIESMIGQTSSRDQSMINRMNMITLGLEQFAKTPILGCGIGASSVLTHGTYLHNNYVELLATSGLVGTILYYSFYFSCFIQFKRSVVEKDYFDISLLLLLICVITDFASVSYFSKTQYMSFIVIMAGIVLSNSTNIERG